MKHIGVIFWKQWKDTLKNKAILIQFLMFPVMVIVMESAVHLEGMPNHFFVFLFATMYIGMAPLVSMASVISEEKEQNTLRVLLMARVRSVEYMVGVGGAFFVACLLGSLVFCLVGGFSGWQALYFMVLMMVGIVISMLLGAAIGLLGKNQMAATSITVPVMMIFAFLPMLSMFNDTIRQVARFTYSRQISLLMNGMGQTKVLLENVVIIGGNLLLVLVLFLLAYRRAMEVRE